MRRYDLALAAEIARRSGDRASAIRYAESALREAAPSYQADDLEDVLGDLHAALGDWPEAIAEFRRVLTINPNRGRTRYTLARALESEGRPVEARAEYERFVRTWSTADADAPELVDALSRLQRELHAGRS